MLFLVCGRRLNLCSPCSPDISWGGAAGSSGCGVCALSPPRARSQRSTHSLRGWTELSFSSAKSTLQLYWTRALAISLSLSRRCWLEDGHTLYCNSSVQSPPPAPCYKGCSNLKFGRCKNQSNLATRGVTVSVLQYCNYFYGMWRRFRSRGFIFFSPVLF